jgi:hypothetical protein
MRVQRFVQRFVTTTVLSASVAGAAWAQPAPVATGPVPAVQGRGQGAFVPVQIGPPAPVPAEVAMLRPTTDELAQINRALASFIDSDSSAAAPVLKKYESILMLQPS